MPMTTLDVMADNHTVPAIFTCWELSEWNVPFRVTKPVNTHRQTTRSVFGAQSSTKPSTKLHAYFRGEIGNPTLRAESREGMRGATAIQ